MSALVCGACHQTAVFTEHEDGSRSWRCPCGRFLGWIGTKGNLDLGIVRDTSLNRRNDFDLFFEEFATINKLGWRAIVQDGPCPIEQEGS